MAKNVAEQIKPPTPPTSARVSRKVELTDNDNTETKEDETVPPADNDSDKPREPENPKQQQEQEAEASEGTEAPAAAFTTMVRAVTSAKQWRRKVKEAVEKRKRATPAQETTTITPRQPTDPQPEAARPMYVLRHPTPCVKIAQT